MLEHKITGIAYVSPPTFKEMGYTVGNRLEYYVLSNSLTKRLEDAKPKTKEAILLINQMKEDGVKIIIDP